MNVSLQKAPQPRTENLLECPVCLSTSQLTYQHPEADIYRCPDCRHCFSDVESISTHESYGDTYHEQSHKNWMEQPNLQLFGWLESQIRQQSDSASVLDIGCGRAQFLSYLAERNPNLELTGIELDSFSAPQRVALVEGDFLTHEFQQKFDCVVSQAVIEHVADVRQFVERAVQLCKPRGRVLIMTLNEQSVLYGAARVLRSIGLSGPFNQLYSKHHLNHFTSASLARLMTDAGLRISARYDHHIPAAAVDFPKQNVLADWVRQGGAQLCFTLGALSGRCYLQNGCWGSWSHRKLATVQCLVRAGHTYSVRGACISALNRRKTAYTAPATALVSKKKRPRSTGPLH